MNEQAVDLEGLFPSSVNFMFWGMGCDQSLPATAVVLKDWFTLYGMIGLD
jgi:hypothetical protein